jgi:hypothetical protein
MKCLGFNFIEVLYSRFRKYTLIVSNFYCIITGLRRKNILYYFQTLIHSLLTSWIY